MRCIFYVRSFNVIVVPVLSCLIDKFILWFERRVHKNSVGCYRENVLQVGRYNGINCQGKFTGKE